MLDALTGLRAHAALATLPIPASGVVGVALDIVGLIHVNDALGHARGDDTVRDVARAIAGLARERGGEVYRTAGDEFLWVLDPASAADAHGSARAAIDRVAALRLPHRDPDGARGHIALNAVILDLLPHDLADVPRLRERVADAIYATTVRTGVRSGTVSVSPAPGA